MALLSELRTKSNRELFVMLLTTDSDDVTIKRLLCRERNMLVVLDKLDDDILEENHQQQQPPPATTPRIRDITRILEAVFINKTKSYSACAEIANTGWDYIDPFGMMTKPPAEIIDFLQAIRYEVGNIDDLHPRRRALLNVIKDAYLRALNNQNGR